MCCLFGKRSTLFGIASPVCSRKRYRDGQHCKKRGWRDLRALTRCFGTVMWQKFRLREVHGRNQERFLCFLLSNTRRAADRVGKKPQRQFIRRCLSMRVKITLACSDCKQRNYDTTKNKKNDPDRLELKKYCRFCRKHTLHKETK